MLTTLLHEYADYNIWANTRFIGRLRTELDAVLDAPVHSSFPSLRKTILHIRDAENAWTCRLNGLPVPWPADAGTDIAGLLAYSNSLRDLVRGYGENQMLEPRSYATLKGDPQRGTVWRMVMHCLNHSTQHRGQLITLMRTLGLEDIPANDLVVYQRTLTA